MVPNGATGVRVYFGEVYIESPGYPDDERDMWTVWDPRPVRQGARCIKSGLSYPMAAALAQAIALPAPSEDK